MATNAALSAQPRDGTGKGSARKLRAAGRVPAVIYGHGEDTRKLSVDAHELMTLFSTIRVENTVITMNIDGEKTPSRALVREVQRHAYRDDVVHVDFYQIHAGESITVAVPVRIVGDAPGVKAGGILQHSLNEIEVRCLPDRIPETLDVDISALEIGDSIHVGDIVQPEGVEFLVDTERTVCSLMAPTLAPVTEEEEEELVAEEEGVEEPEVITRGKGEDEGEEGGEGE
jgi:large subunit ribosomal protein L25